MWSTTVLHNRRTTDLRQCDTFRNNILYSSFHPPEETQWSVQQEYTPTRNKQNQLHVQRKIKKDIIRISK